LVNAVQLMAPIDHTRESSDIPRLNAFCRVAPSVRFKLRAIRAAWVFFLAPVFNVRISAEDQARLFFIFISSK